MVNPEDLAKSASGISISQVEGLDSKSADEVAIRCAIHLTYYALYHKALEFALSDGFVAPPRSTHSALSRHYTSSKDKVKQGIGVNLRDAFSARVLADYKLGGSLTESDKAAQNWRYTVAVNGINSLTQPKNEEGEQ